MAVKNEAKIRFSAETKDFDKGIKDANSTLATLRNELKLNEAQMKTNGTTVEGLRDKQKNLTAQMDAAQDKTKALSDKLAVAVDVFGENSTEANKLRNQLINAQTAEVKLQGAIDRCNAELERQEEAANRVKTESEKLSDTISDQQSELDKLKKAYAEYVVSGEEASEEARELAEQIAELSDELRENRNRMDDANRAADELDRSLDDVGDSAEDAADGGFTVLKGAMADLVSSGIQSVIGGLGDLFSYFGQLPQETMEIRQDMGTLVTAFDNVGLGAETATDTWKELYKVFGEDDRAVETANNIARIADNEKELNDWVKITTGIWGTYQDSLPVEGLAEAAAETAKTGTVTGGLADALNWSTEAATMFADYMSEDVVTAEDAFNEALAACSTEAERQALITDTLTALYGGAADKYRETTSAQMEAKEATAETILAENELASVIEPVTVEFANMKNELLVGILPVVKDTVDAFLAFSDWCQEHKGTIAALATTIGVVSTAIGAYNIVNGVKAAMEKAEVDTVWKLVAAYWAKASATMAAVAPYILIVAAIAAVIAIIVLCVKYWDEIVAAVKKAWEAIKETLAAWGEWINTNVIQPVAEFFSGLWDGITTGVKAAWDWIVGLFNTFTSWVYNNLITPVGKFFTDLWNGIVNGVTSAWNWVVGLISTVGAWIYNNLIAPVTQFFVDLWNGIVNAFHTVIDPWIEIIRRASVLVYNEIVAPIMQFFTDLWNSIVAGIQAAWDWVVGISNTITAWIYNNVTQPIQNFFIELWNGIVNGVQAAWDWVVALAVTIATWINENVIQPSINFFTNLWNSIVSGVQNAIQTVKDVFNAVKTWLNSNIIQPIGNFFSSLWDGFKNGAQNAWQGIKDVFSKVASFFKDIFSKAWTGVKNVFSVGGKIFDGIKDGIVNAFKSVVNVIIKGLNKVVSIPFNGLNNVLNKISGISILGVSPFSWLTWRAPVPQIPMLAQGGILTQPTLNIAGEAGPEAVIPIDKLQSYISSAIDKTMQTVNMNALVSAVEDLANRAIELNINGRQFAVATAADTDNVSGNRYALTKRGLAL